MRATARFAMITATLLQGSAAMATETPRYTVTRQLADSVELREYGRWIVAETELESAEPGRADGEGFRRLADYIFGNNRGRRQLAMTTPVVREQGGRRIAMTSPVTREQKDGPSGRFVMQFVMPSAETLQTLPEPADDRVVIRELPARVMAALRYSGHPTEARLAEKTDELRAVVARSGLRPVGAPVYARYNPPWTPWFMRRNEVLVEVAPLPPTPPR